MAFWRQISIFFLLNFPLNSGLMWKKFCLLTILYYLVHRGFFIYPEICEIWLNLRAFQARISWLQPHLLMKKLATIFFPTTAFFLQGTVTIVCLTLSTVLGFVFYLLWLVLITDSPATHFAFATICTDPRFMQKSEGHNPPPLLYWAVLFVTWNVWLFLTLNKSRDS